jgi:hypothetical protein
MGEEIFMGRYSVLEEEKERKKRSGRRRSTHSKADSGIRLGVADGMDPENKERGERCSQNRNQTENKKLQ